jgi:hypothetical protein
MKALLISTSIAAVLLLQGCETTASLTNSATTAVKNFGKYETGTFVGAETMAALVDRKSTQADVIAAIGRTNDRRMLSGREVWNYGYTKISQFGGNVSETTVFEFDRKGVLVAHYKTKGNKDSGNALTQAVGS